MYRVNSRYCLVANSGGNSSVLLGSSRLEYKFRCYSINIRNKCIQWHTLTTNYFMLVGGFWQFPIEIKIFISIGFASYTYLLPGTCEVQYWRLQKFVFWGGARAPSKYQVFTTMQTTIARDNEFLQQYQTRFTWQIRLSYPTGMQVGFF